MYDFGLGEVRSPAAFVSAFFLMCTLPTQLPKDHKRACQLYEEVALTGFAPAMFNLGLLSREQEPKETPRLLTPSAQLTAAPSICGWNAPPTLA